MLHPKISPRWTDRHTVVVAATGPSLTPEVVERVKASAAFVVAVNDAYKVFPWASVLYACDTRWWDVHEGAVSFTGSRWSSHGHNGHNDKLACAGRWGLNLVHGKHGAGFSRDPEFIHYGQNSGFQAINLTILMGARRLVLVGFDMRSVNGRRH